MREHFYADPQWVQAPFPSHTAVSTIEYYEQSVLSNLIMSSLYPGCTLKYQACISISLGCICIFLPIFGKHCEAICERAVFCARKIIISRMLSNIQITVLRTGSTFCLTQKNHYGRKDSLHFPLVWSRNINFHVEQKSTRRVKSVLKKKHQLGENIFDLHRVLQSFFSLSG